jgi:hypothetical protein
MKILSFSLMMSLTLTLLTVGIVTALSSINIQTAEARVNDCSRDDDPTTICRVGGGKDLDGNPGGGGHRDEFDTDDPSLTTSGGDGGKFESDRTGETIVGGDGGSRDCDILGDCKDVGGEGRHIQGEGDQGSEDN